MNQIKEDARFKNHFSLSNNFEEFIKTGVCYVTTFEDKISSIASSFCNYRNSIEIQVNTSHKFQKIGAASSVCAALLIEAQSRNITPCWDAATNISKKLGSKLGFKEIINYQIFLSPYLLFSSR